MKVSNNITPQAHAHAPLPGHALPIVGKRIRVVPPPNIHPQQHRVAPLDHPAVFAELGVESVRWPLERRHHAGFGVAVEHLHMCVCVRAAIKKETIKKIRYVMIKNE